MSPFKSGCGYTKTHKKNIEKNDELKICNMAENIRV